MKRAMRLTTTLVAVPLAVAACGASPTKNTSTDLGPGGAAGGSSPLTAARYGTSLLAEFHAPSTWSASAHAPSKVLETLPTRAMLVKPPVVQKRFWTVNQSAAAVYAWLGSHGPAIASGGSGSSGAAGDLTRFRAYDVRRLPPAIAYGELTLVVAPLGPNRSAVAAYAVTLATPQRPVAEKVPTPDKVIVGWTLGAGGTPVRKTLVGVQASALTHEFDALPLTLQDDVPCPMIPNGSTVTLTFTANGHTWKANVMSCPGIGVQLDGTSLPTLQATPAFMSDLKALGVVFRMPGGVTPLVQPGGSH